MPLTLGSPPRMRGKPPDFIKRSFVLRITPADAGKTTINVPCMTSCTDHPRGCGENQKKMFDEAYKAGSPPRMRGKPAIHGGSPSSRRITPADAGKTYDNTVKTEPREDHPRGCGENNYGKEGTTMTKGSPPRMRGKPIAGRFRDVLGRITPADAGKT